MGLTYLSYYYYNLPKYKNIKKFLMFLYLLKKNIYILILKNYDKFIIKNLENKLFEFKINILNIYFEKIFVNNKVFI